MILVTPSFSTAEGLTEKTGQEILRELKAIREALERRPSAPQAPQQAAPQPPPPPTRAKVSVSGSKTIGDAKAPVTLIEFTDYQCPYCKRFYDGTFAEIKKNYIDTGKVKFVSRNLPLAFHNNAKKAAQAALCAGDQGKYWEMRDVLFSNTQALDADKLPGYAEGLKLDMKKFGKCLEGGDHLDKIDADMKEAQSAGITGTPSFILGMSAGEGPVEGERVVGAQPFAAFEGKIKALLEGEKKQ